MNDIIKISYGDEYITATRGEVLAAAHDGLTVYDRDGVARLVYPGQPLGRDYPLLGGQFFNPAAALAGGESMICMCLIILIIVIAAKKH